MLPPYIVYKAKHSYVGWTEGGIEGARYNRTLSGWFDATIFEDWFYSIILPHFKKLDGHKVLVGDNLSSHVTLSVIQECENNNIRFVLLPPNSTHLLQPLDVAYFRPLKAAWKKVLETWKLRNRGVLPKTLFSKLLKEAVESVGLKSQANYCRVQGMWHHPHQKTPKPGGRDSESEDEHGEANNKNISDIESDLEVAESEKSFTEDYEIGEPSTLFENLTEEQNSLPEEQNSEVFIVNDYVLVKFKTNRRDRHFIAKIETVSGTNC
ncbi:hypothetical protein JTB14_020617 [Gonioctena quinquepunctata]|nr:hypothetical protein JTB14_020617 [Gonioctena quinquepunctata]